MKKILKSDARKAFSRLFQRAAGNYTLGDRLHRHVAEDGPLSGMPVLHRAHSEETILKTPSSLPYPRKLGQPVQIPVMNDTSDEGFHPHIFTPFRFLASRGGGALSVASLDMQDGIVVRDLVW